MDQGPTSTGEHTGVIALESTVLTASLPEKSEPPQSACLVILFGAEIGRRVTLAEREVVIGRASSADLQIDAESVSRTHAVLRRNARGYVLRDRDSTNGTFVNDQPIRERMLKDGDQIRIGRAMLKFLTSDNRAVEQETFHHEDEIIPVTISLGLAEFQPALAGDNAELLVKRADQQLYAAKHGGRNRIAP